MENKAKLIGLLPIALLIFTLAAIVISPPAWASKGQVMITNVGGTPQDLWNTGDTLFVTVIDPDENRDSDEVELLRGTFTDELGVEHPLVELVDPNTGDVESSIESGALVLQETGVDTGEFRSFPGLPIVRLEDDQVAIPDNGILEVRDNDSIYVYYTDPSDPSDIDVDLAKIGFNYAEIKITDRAGNEVPLFNVGDDVFVTVWDSDENLDPTDVETIEGVTLMNPRTGAMELLTLVETGPDTGIFRNVDGVLLQDDLGTTPESSTDLVLPVLDKDTLVAFYRSPVGVAPPPVGRRCAENEFIKFCRTAPASVAAGESFTVKDEVTAKVALKALTISDRLAANFTLVSGNLRRAALDVAAGTTITNEYTVTATTSGTITGTATPATEAGVQAGVTVDSPIEVIVAASAVAEGFPIAIERLSRGESEFITFTREVPDSVMAGETFTVTDTVTAKVALRAVVISDKLPPGYSLVSGSLKKAQLDVPAGGKVTNTYTVRAGERTAAITGTATPATEAGVQAGVTLTTEVVVGVVPPVGVGKGDFNDPSDFILDTADVAEPNPSTVVLTDENGMEKREFRITEDVYITVRDDDENVDSDLAETVYVNVYNPNGGRELHLALIETGLNTGVFRNPDALKIVGVDSDLGQEDITADAPGVLAVHNRDTIYVEYADKEQRTYDPFDISYAWARIYDCEVFTPEANKIWFTSDVWVPIAKVKKGQEVFVKVEDCDQNEYSELVDSFIATLYDRNTGDIETVRLVETGPNTGVFVSRKGVPLWRPEGGMTPAMVGDGTLQIEDRDTIFVWYQDPNNPGDFAVAKAELAPRPITPVCFSRTRFTDAQGRDVARYVVGDNVYVTVEDCEENRTPGVVDTIKGALVVENPRTGIKVMPDLIETGPDTGVFLSEPITTGEPGSGAMLEVEPGDTLKATYTDPDDPTDVSSDDVAIEARVFEFIDAVNQPNPLVTVTMFKALGTGILNIEVRVWDLAGRLVWDSGKVAGSSLSWDGDGLANGVYLYTVQAFGRGEASATSRVKKLVILK